MEELQFQDKTPPHNLEAEQAVIGSILLEPQTVILAMEKLRPADFYRPQHQLLFETIIDLNNQAIPIDIIALASRLSDRQQLEEAGGLTYITQLAQGVPSAANLEYYAQLVEEKAILRRLISTATHIANEGYAQASELQSMLDAAEKKIAAIGERRSGDGFKVIKDVLVDVLDRIEFLYNNKGGNTGVSTGYVDLDQMTSGLQRSDLIILAARPSVGKTAFALNLAQNVAIRTKETVAIFSLEMAADQLVRRMLCAEANIDAGVMRSGHLKDDDWEKLMMAIGTMSEANLFIDDTFSITTADIRSRCRKLKKEHGLGLIVIDYLQLITGKSGGKGTADRQQEVSEISRTLKSIARELNVPIIALSQLSRSVEQRQDKRPMLSDLRESGAIEQDADIVSFLYRDDYYNPETDKKNIVELIIAKHRNGPVGSVELVFLKNFNKFVNLHRGPESSSA